jgi:glycolate oxidase
MPKPDAALLADRARLLTGLKATLPGGVIENPAELAAYASDGLTAYEQIPMAVALPRNTGEVSRLLAFCNSTGLKVVPRGAGTSLSGGALPLADSVVVGMARFNRILAVDYDNRAAVVQPGVTNLAISHAVADRGFYYAPDPSSQIACSIGGNVAENSGGVHCLKYGMTSNNLLGVEMVLIDGTVVRLGSRGLDSAGYDILGVICGSEGMLGVVTEVTVRILPRPETQRALLIGFPSMRGASQCVADIIAEGIIPAALEIMDRPATHAAEAFVHAGYPLDVEALMIAELDGTPAEVDELLEAVASLARRNGADFLKSSTSEAERMLFWAGRKAAFPAVGRISPDYYCVDGSIPRKALPDMLDSIAEMSRRRGLRVVNVFHAGDGNLHPTVLYDSNVPGQLDAAEAFGAEILEACVAFGGVLTGEHGVGVEKRDLMPRQFTPTDLEQQIRLKCAFDAQGLLNPGKVFPILHRCAELGRMHVHSGRTRFPDLPRL